MKSKDKRIETLKMLISSKELSSQEDVLKALEREGFQITQATLSRDMKKLKVAKASGLSGEYVYVLPNDSMYRRSTNDISAKEMRQSTGFVSFNLSLNTAVIKTRPGYSSSLAYNIDNSGFPEVLGTIAGYDTIVIILREGVTREQLLKQLETLIPNIRKGAAE